MGYFPDKWNCSEAKRMNKKLTKIYKEPADSEARLKMRENKSEMIATQNKNKYDHIKTMFEGKEKAEGAKKDEFEISAYKRMHAFGEEEQKMVNEDPQ